MAAPKDDNGGDTPDFRVVRRLHFVFTDHGLERTSPEVADKTQLVRVIIDIPKPVYRRVEEIASRLKAPVETIILEWITKNAA